MTGLDDYAARRGGVGKASAGNRLLAELAAHVATLGPSELMSFVTQVDEITERARWGGIEEE